MSPLIRPLVPALALIFAPSGAFAEAAPSASTQEVSAPVAAPQPTVTSDAQQAPSPSIERTDEPETGIKSTSTAAEVQASSEVEADPAALTTAPTGTEPSDAAAASEADALEATSNDNPMPSHAPLRAHSQGAERRRRVPLFMFTDVQGMVRFTEEEPAIQEKARSIAGRATASFWISNGSAALAGGLVAFSFPGPNCDTRPGSSRCEGNLGLLLTGLGTLVVGQVVAYLIAPKEPDYVELIEAWNATIDEAIVPESAIDPRGTDAPAQQAP